jgi:putative tryptophan/tyrosine transport system substrate-binding protein
VARHSQCRQPTLRPQWLAFDQRLHELGYSAGHDLESAFRNAEGRATRFATFATDLVHRKPDVLGAAGTEASLRAAQHATRTIPIVLVAIGFDPMALGYVTSLAKPGGTSPACSSVNRSEPANACSSSRRPCPQSLECRVLWDTFGADQLREAEAVAPLLGIQLHPVELRDPPYDFERAFTTVAEGGVRRRCWV